MLHFNLFPTCILCIVAPHIPFPLPPFFLSLLPCPSSSLPPPLPLSIPLPLSLHSSPSPLASLFLSPAPLYLLPSPSSCSRHLASVVGDPLFDPLFSGDSEGRRDRKADGGEPLIFLEMEEEPPGSSQGGKNCVCVCMCPCLRGCMHAAVCCWCVHFCVPAIVAAYMFTLGLLVPCRRMAMGPHLPT